ncbi:MAG: prolyl-tRNA synthetase associated domain-containing protein [Cohaesibacter sp.]|nr:prolyl-tRNA synthetase associated domain-containing protein [Cohaesibacter sp.]
MTLSSPASRQDLLNFLSELGIETKTHDHEAVFTVAESQKIKESLPGGHTKNLFLKDKKGNIGLVVCLNDTEVDLKSFHKKTDFGRVSFGNADLLWELLGVKPGSVTPFALINDKDTHKVRLFLDANMMEQELLNYHPLENTATTAIQKDDLLTFFAATGHEPTTIKLEKED